MHETQLDRSSVILITNVSYYTVNYMCIVIGCNSLEYST